MKLDPRPNILVVFTDQQRLDTISAWINNFKTNTPAMDSFVKRGVRFSNAYCTAPICSPSRSTLITGEYPTKAGVPGNLTQPNGPLDEGKFSIGKRMQALGYETVYHGKWHLGGDIANHGFEKSLECSHDASTVDEAARFYRNRDWMNNRHRPFFHMVSLLDPHDVYFQMPGGTTEETFPEWENLNDDLSTKPFPQQLKGGAKNWPAEKRNYYRDFYKGKVEKVDAQIERLIDELNCSGFGPNTFIIFTADHGDMACEHGIALKGPFMYDGVAKVPLIICPPMFGMSGMTACDPQWKDYQPREEDAVVSLIDIVPTILDIAGGEPDPELSGRSLVPALHGKIDDAEMAVCEWIQWGTYISPIRMVRSKNWKYVNYIGIGEELYDMDNDPHEITNRATDPDCAAVLEEHRALLKKHCEQNDDPFFSMSPTPREEWA
jgi:arylsulfatase A-like enzyme